MKRNIFIAGHEGMVGSAFVRYFELKADVRILTASRRDLDLTNQEMVRSFFQENQIDEIFLCAAKVGGIGANSTFPAQFIYENLAIQNNVIHEAYSAGINKLLFLGSSCIYPRDCSQPISESSLLAGPLEATNEPYAIAKITGLKLCEYYSKQYGVNYYSVMPTNLYGPNDSYDLKNSHVLPALIRKFHEAKQLCLPTVSVWGSGSPQREFLHVDDLVKAAVAFHEIGFRLATDSGNDRRPSFVNIGSGSEVTIAELAQTVSRVVGFTGEITFDTSKPDGTPRKLLDCSLLSDCLPNLEVRDLEQGIHEVYQAYAAEVTTNISV